VDDTTRVDIEHRLAVLEERTRPKPKSVAEFAKDWAGVGTLLIALLYTFPLGVWDRFFVTAEQARRLQVESLRNLVIRLTELDGDAARNFYTITNEQLRASYLRAISAQKLALISRSSDNVAYNFSELSTPEMVLIAYNLAQAGQVAFADKIYVSALHKASQDKNVSLRADIYRMRSQLFYANPTGTDMAKVRENFSRGIGILLEAGNPGFLLQASNSAFEWGLFELAAGDWACGQSLAEWAIRTASALPPISPDVETYASDYRKRLANFKRRTNQPGIGCEKALVSWLLQG
jgi:hypothetical protein